MKDMTWSCLLCGMALSLSLPLGAADKGIDNETCLDCHSDEDLTRETADGKEVSVYVDAKKLAASAHKDKRC